MFLCQPRSRLLRGLVLAACLRVLACAAAAQPADWSLRSWQVEEGLLENTVTGIAQSPEGYLWVTTLNGLARFDGVRFQRVLLPPSTPGGGQPVRTLLFARDRRLWVALDGGGLVGLAERSTNVFTAAEGLTVQRPLVLAEDADGAIWSGYTDGSACRVAAGRVTRFTAAEGLTGQGACWVASDTTGQLWFAKSGRIGVWRDGQFVSLLTVPERTAQLTAAKAGGVWVSAGGRVFRFAEGGQPEPLATLATDRPSVEPRSVFEDRAGAVWVGTATDGLFRCDPSGAVRVETTHGEVVSLAQDTEGNVWAGTGGGGLNRVRPRVLELQGTAAGLPFETVRSVCEDQSGRVWAVALNGELASLENGRWRKATTDETWNGIEATCVAGDGQGGVWVGTRHHGILQLVNGKISPLRLRAGATPMAVRALLLDRAGALWAGVESSGAESPNGVQRWHHGQVKLFTQPPGSRVVRAMAEDASGRLWLGTPDGTLLRADGEALVEETARTLPQPKPIRSLLATPDGAVWIGYAGTGLGRLKNGRFSRFGPEQGLPDGYVSSLLADGHGALWVACTRGLFRVPFAELQSVADGRAERIRTVPQERAEGLRNLQANYGHWPGALHGRDGRLWFPMRTGLAVVQPDRVRRNTVPPPVLIERVLVDGQPLATGPGAAAQLPGGHRKVEVEYTAPSFSGPENVNFRHRLTGWDEGWVEAGTERRVSYSRLPAGRYEFRVTACTEAGVWNEAGAALAFTVTPLYWQTGWFRLGAASAFTLGLVALVRYVSFRRLRAKLQRIEQEAAVHRERARIAKDIHDDLGASLTQISLLGDLVEQDLSSPEKAGEHARTLSRTARQLMKTLDETVWAVNPRNDTLAHLLDYTGQFAVDFLRVAGVRCRVDFPLQPPARAVAAEVRHHLFLVVKEALHNVVKHARATEVRLRATVSEQTFQLSVEDDGQGFSSAPDNALADGLRNMQQRLAEIGGTCQITSRPGQGTRVQVELPWPKG
ncbi:MAG: ATP-binding protein [Verrucomicrobia bacterium]|nr:ATP-binding protein [Verrucomicrobiota bacterium]